MNSVEWNAILQQWPQTSKEVTQQQLSSPGRDESSIAGTANGFEKRPISLIIIGHVTDV